jgi:hypothetical protein
MAKYSSKVMGKEVGQAAEYAEPHTMNGKKLTGQEAVGERTFIDEKAAKDISLRDAVRNGVSVGKSNEPKTSGIEMRGAGAATKGRMSRGPMA